MTTEVTIKHRPNPNGTVDVELRKDGEVVKSETVSNYAGLADAHGRFCGEAASSFDRQLGE
jgi:hypothetical protein